MGVALPLASAGSFDSTKGARILVVVQMMTEWEWGREEGRKGGGDGGGGGGDRKINKRCKGEYCRALTNVQRMPVSIRPSQSRMRGEEARVYMEQGYSLKLSARLQSEPRGCAQAAVSSPVVKRQRKKTSHFGTGS